MEYYGNHIIRILYPMYGGWEGTLAGVLVLRRASLSLCWLTMTRVNLYTWSMPALRT